MLFSQLTRFVIVRCRASGTVPHDVEDAVASIICATTPHRPATIGSSIAASKTQWACWSGACKSCGSAKLVDCPHERNSKQRCTWYQLVGTPRTRVQSTGTIGELWSLFKRKLLALREHYYHWWHQYWTTKRMRSAAALTAPGGGNNVYVHIDASAKYEHEHMHEVHQEFLTRERTGIVVCRMRTQRATF